MPSRKQIQTSGDNGKSAPIPRVKTLYVLAFTADEMPVDVLQPVVHIADSRLRKKNPAFAMLMEKHMQPKTKIEVANIKYAGPLMHTPQAMQHTLGSWIRDKYKAGYKPVLGSNFFPHGMRDPQGRDNYFLFYFEMETR